MWGKLQGMKLKIERSPLGLVLPVYERWAALVGDADPLWVEVVAIEGREPRFYHRELKEEPLIIATGITPGEPEKPSTWDNPLSLEALRRYIRQTIPAPNVRALWYGPVAPGVDYKNLTRAKIQTLPCIDPNQISLAFRLHYKDEVFNLDKACAAVSAFAADAITMAMNRPHEEVREVHITVAFNNPDAKRTQIVAAKEGDAWPDSELGFSRK